MAKMVELERGLFIHRFESSLRLLEDPDSPQVQFRELESGEVAVQFSDRNRPISTQLILIYSQGRWRFQLLNQRMFR